jgi:hypothetical protein
LVLSCLPTHLFSIPFITRCVFNPLFPLMSLSEIVYCQCCVYCIGARRVLVPMFVYILFLLVLWSMLRGHSLKDSILHSVFDSPAPDFPATYTHDSDIWIQNYLRNKDFIWNIIPHLIFQQIGGLELLLKCNFDMGKIPIKLANFHKQVLLTWNLMYKHNLPRHRYTIWNNKDIKYKNKSLFFQNWFDNIIWVKQLLNNDGQLYDYPEFENTQCYIHS